MKNQIKTVLLLTTLSALFLLIGYSLGGQSGIVSALVMSLVMNFAAYWFSDKLVLAMHNAKPIKQGDASGVYEMVTDLSLSAKLPCLRCTLFRDRSRMHLLQGEIQKTRQSRLRKGLSKF